MHTYVHGYIATFMHALYSYLCMHALDVYGYLYVATSVYIQQWRGVVMINKYFKRNVLTIDVQREYKCGNK